MKNIFVEGIQGSGKTTLVDCISELNTKLHVCREGDYCPVELAWCALMNEQEYKNILEKYPSVKEEIVRNTVREKERLIVSYTKIETNISGFYKDLESYEVYNGRRPLSEFKEIIIDRYRNFTETGYLFECSFFQNIIEDLILFHMLSDEEILSFYQELFELVDKSSFLLLYLFEDRLEESIGLVRKERCDEEGNEVWFRMLSDYVEKSPYGKKHGFATFEDLVRHLKHRQDLELKIIQEILDKNAVILPAKQYDKSQIKSLIGFQDKTEYKIRHIRMEETAVLDEFLYEAIYIPEGVEAPSKNIIKAPELQVYVKDFGTRESDICLVAEADENIVGAVWVRVMDDYGHVEEGVPSFAISLYKEYRGLGIGTEMMRQMLRELKERGYRKASLAVQKKNYAVKMYEKVGFKRIGEKEEEYLMMCNLS